MMFVALVFVALADTPSVEELVRAQESGRGLIRTLDVAFDIYEHVQVDDMATLKSHHLPTPRLDLECHWVRDGKLERLGYILKTGVESVGGVARDRGVYVTDGTTVRVLENLDPSDATHFKPGLQGPIKAMVAPHVAAIAGFPNVRSYFLLECSNGLMSFPVPLRKALEGFTRITVNTSALVSEHTTYEISATHPASQSRSVELHVCIDPLAGFLVRRTVAREDTSVGVRVTTREVTDFQEIGRGVFFPAAIRQTVTYPHRNPMPTSDTTVKVRNLRVNQVIAPNQFQLPFPADLMVHVFTAGADTHKLQLWGADDRPVRTITDVRELAEGGRPEGPTFPWLTVAFGGIAASGVAWLIWVSWRRWA